MSKRRCTPFSDPRNWYVLQARECGALLLRPVPLSPTSTSCTALSLAAPKRLLDSSISLSPLYPNQTNDLPCCVHSGAVR